jgi:hypothetical protein
LRQPFSDGKLNDYHQNSRKNHKKIQIIAVRFSDGQARIYPPSDIEMSKKKACERKNKKHD